MRCINCSIALSPFTGRRNLVEVADGAIHLLRTWINPTEVSVDDDALCAQCCDILDERLVNPGLGLPALGYQHQMCLSCGLSIRNKRSCKVMPNCPERNVIFRWVPAHLVNRLERVCRACWMCATREIQRNEQYDRNQNIVVLDEDLVLDDDMELLDEDLLLDDERMVDDNQPLADRALVPPPPPPPPLAVDEVQMRPQPQTIPLPDYRRAAATARRCLFDDCIEGERFIVPAVIKERLLLDYRFYVPLNSRICGHHLRRNNWADLDSQLHDFNTFQIQDMMTILFNANKRDINFDDIDNMSEHLCHYWLGINAVKFNELLLHIPQLHHRVKSASVALSILLVKLRTGDSNERLCTLFKMASSSLEKHMTIARDCMYESFVPTHLGLGHMRIEEVAARNKLIPDGLFGNPDLPVDCKPAITICDGTYIYIQSSSNYSFQKQTYSLHKYNNLVKPFMIVCCDGYILQTLGPYPATKNDSSIMNDVFEHENGAMRLYFRQGDSFILDRGFRDVVPKLREYGYEAHMPETLEDGEHQLSTIQANRSRCVTMCRWVVEVVNGRIKRDFKIFREDYFNRASEHLMKDFNISCALLNKFHSLIEDNPDALEYLNTAIARLNVANQLSDFVQRSNLNRRRAVFNNIDGDNQHLENFPRLTIPELKKFALGSYQLKQARSYYGEHIRQNGRYALEICNELEQFAEFEENSSLIRGRVRSRHVGGRTYFTYVMLKFTNENRDSLKVITGYCCNCLVGRRTVGCCAHVMSIVWYLSWARYNDVNAPASFLDHIFDNNPMYQA